MYYEIPRGKKLDVLVTHSVTMVWNTTSESLKYTHPSKRRYSQTFGDRNAYRKSS